MFVTKKEKKKKNQRIWGEKGKLFLKEYQLKIVCKQKEFLKSPFCNSHVITDSWKLPKWMLKSLSVKLLGNKTHSLQISPHRLLINCKRKMCLYHGDLVIHQFNQMVKWYSGQTNWHQCTSLCVIRKIRALLVQNYMIMKSK